MNKNPFVLPGFGQSGPLGQNPILASMEMMRQAWEGLASSGGMDTAAMGRMMSVEEMDKRISDLRAVENWLRMNLSMLSSTIQGLEVQRATVATLKSFVDTGMASMAQSGAAGGAGSRDTPRQASPLEEVLGLRPGAGQGAASGHEPSGDASGRGPSRATPGQGASAGMAGDAHAADAEKRPAGSQAPSGPAAEAGGASAAAAPGIQPEQADIVGAAASAAQGWWNLLQQQFQTLASATAASAEGAFSELAEAGKAAAAAAGAAGSQAASAKPAAKKPAGAKSAGKSATKAASRSAAAPAAKSASKATGGKTAKTAKTASKTPRKAASARKTSR